MEIVRLHLKGRSSYGAVYKKPTLNTFKDTDRPKVQGWKKIYHANTNQKKAVVTILILDKVDFTARNINHGYGRWFHDENGVSFLRRLTIINVYAFNNRTSRFMKQKVIKLKEIENPSV